MVADDGYFVVEKLVDRRKHKNKIQYRVRWSGFGAADDTHTPVPGPPGFSPGKAGAVHQETETGAAAMRCDEKGLEHEQQMEQEEERVATEGISLGSLVGTARRPVFFCV